MNLTDVINHFGTARAVAAAVGVIPATVYSWKSRGIPRARQFQLHVLSDGRLAVTPAAEPSRGGVPTA